MNRVELYINTIVNIVFDNAIFTSHGRTLNEINSLRRVTKNVSAFSLKGAILGEPEGFPPISNSQGVIDANRFMSIINNREYLKNFINNNVLKGTLFKFEDDNKRDEAISEILTRFRSNHQAHQQAGKSRKRSQRMKRRTRKTSRRRKQICKN